MAYCRRASEGRRSERAVRNENVAWSDTERISTRQISHCWCSYDSTFGISRWNKAIGINPGKVLEGGWAGAARVLEV